MGVSTALVVVDVQNDFVDPKGSLYVPGGEEVVEAVNRLVAEHLAAGDPVFYTQDWHPASTPHFAKDGGAWPVHCVAGTWGAQLAPGLRVEGPVVRKGTGQDDGYSGFFVRDSVSGQVRPTELEGLVRQSGAGRVVVAGVAGDVCVRATALDALALGLEVAVAWPAVRCVEPAKEQEVRRELAASGVGEAG